jgi:hypothetical protein
MNVKERVRRKRSPQGNWIVVEYRHGEIFYVSWVHSWAGAQASKRNKMRYIKAQAEMMRVPPERVGRVLILDIYRMMDFAVTEAANDINELHRLWEL